MLCTTFSNHFYSHNSFQLTSAGKSRPSVDQSLCKEADDSEQIVSTSIKKHSLTQKFIANVRSLARVVNALQFAHISCYVLPALTSLETHRNFVQISSLRPVCARYAHLFCDPAHTQNAPTRTFFASPFPPQRPLPNPTRINFFFNPFTFL